MSSSHTCAGRDCSLRLRMPDPETWTGRCLLCGENLTLDNVIPGSRIHDCEGGRILHDKGLDAYVAWLAKRKGVSVQETLDELLFRHGK